MKPTHEIADPTWRDILQRDAEILLLKDMVLTGIQKARAEERAAVVAWLREDAEILLQRYDRTCAHVENLAAQIERGEHRREEEP